MLTQNRGRVARAEKYNRKKWHFSRDVKHAALEKTGYRCFVTNEPHHKKDPIEIHHMLPIRVWYDYFRDQVPASVLTSVINAVPLKRSIHQRLHDEADLDHYEEVANFLMSIWTQQDMFAEAGD